ncbi:MAG: sel1 repeat family protein [Sedimenticola sp.]|nr:sel1 repeat family protein [Sedimenticola sp.]
MKRWSAAAIWFASFALMATPASADVAAIDALGWDHYLGRNGRALDYVRARSLFEQGVQENYPLSHYGLATLYSRGLGVERDYLRARYHYEKAAEGGVRRAYYNLGVFYHMGLGVTQDNARARELFARAAKMGEPHACLALGIFDEEGLSGSVDLTSAKQWYREAVAGGVVEAQQRLNRLMPEVHEESRDEK